MARSLRSGVGTKASGSASTRFLLLSEICAENLNSFGGLLWQNKNAVVVTERANANSAKALAAWAIPATARWIPIVRHAPRASNLASAVIAGAPDKDKGTRNWPGHQPQGRAHEPSTFLPYRRALLGMPG